MYHFTESGSDDGTGGNYSIAAYYANVGGIVGGLVGGLLSLIIICLALALLTTGFLSLRKTGKQLSECMQGISLSRGF